MGANGNGNGNGNGVGRPTSLTPEVRKMLVDNVKIGMPFREAALAAGVSERSFHNWKIRGEKEKSGEFFLFVQELKEAEGTAQRALLARIQKAAQSPKTWQAAAWILERRHPDLYGQKVRTEVSNPEGDALSIVVRREIVHRSEDSNDGAKPDADD